MAEVNADRSFPSLGYLVELNGHFEQLQSAKKYDENIKLARERGYEHPKFFSK